jgi:hypothetical protein
MTLPLPRFEKKNRAREKEIQETTKHVRAPGRRERVTAMGQLHNRLIHENFY